MKMRNERKGKESPLDPEVVDYFPITAQLLSVSFHTYSVYSINTPTSPRVFQSFRVLYIQSGGKMLWHIISNIMLKCPISFCNSHLVLLLGVCRVLCVYITLYTGLTSQSLYQKYSIMTQNVIIFICTYQPIVFDQIRDIFDEIHRWAFSEIHTNLCEASAWFPAALPLT